MDGMGYEGITDPQTFHSSTMSTRHDVTQVNQPHFAPAQNLGKNTDKWATVKKPGLSFHWILIG